MSVVFNTNSRYKIFTPDGWQTFTGVQKLIKPRMIEISFEEIKDPIKCSLNHPFLNPEGTLTIAGDLTEGDVLIHQDMEFVTVLSLQVVEGEVELYDILDAGKERLFYSNGVVSHNCEFIGSSNTLLSDTCLKNMVFKDPVEKIPTRFSHFQGGNAFLDIHKRPEKDRLYVMTADVAEGKEQDASAYVVFDVTQIPYEVVAKYASNQIENMLFADEIASCATLYNDAWVLVENNNNDVAKMLHDNIEYENVISTTQRNKRTQVGGGFGGKNEFGLKSNKLTKLQGCLNLKTFLENNQLITTDVDIYNELTQFVANSRGSWSAEVGHHDDLAICLVHFSWLANQTYFKELINQDIYKSLKEGRIASYEDICMFFVDDHSSSDSEDWDGLRL